MTGFLVVLGVLAVPLVAVAVSYNRFVEQRQLIRDSWANVDTELQRRYDLIPNLVETVQGYAVHERTVLTAVTEARARAAANHGSPAAQAHDENTLASSLRHLFAVAEGYPDLRASPHFLALQEELVTTEDRIQAARRFFNANVRAFNRRVQALPSNLVAWVWRFEPHDYFEVEPAVRRSGPPAVWR